MPPKAVTLSSPSHNLTAKEVEMLAALATLMGEVPSIDYEALAGMVGIKLGKNARQALRNIFKKLQSQHGAADSSTSAPATKATATQAEESEVDQESDEKNSPKKVVAKKGTVAKKPAAAKKTVGKTTTPKKAGAAGPKPPANTKGKGKKSNTENAEAEHATKTESSDEPMKNQDEDGKLPQSLSSVNEMPPPATYEIALSVATNGEVMAYTPRDVEVAKSHQVSLVEYLIWKSTNNYDFYLNEDQSASACQGAFEISSKV